MLTLQIILFLLKAWIPVIWSIIEAWWFPYNYMSNSSGSDPAMGQPALDTRRGARRSVRWVVPIQTDLSQPADPTLPTPLVMLDPPSDSASAKTRKKRM